MPWLIPGGEYQPRMSLVLGVICALPFWLATRWLAHSPYHALATGCWVIVGLWGLHSLISLIAMRSNKT